MYESTVICWYVLFNKIDNPNLIKFNILPISNYISYNHGS